MNEQANISDGSPIYPKAMTEPEVSLPKLSIDKLDITLHINNLDHAKGIAGELMNLAKDTEFASQAYAKNSRYRISVRIKLPGGQSALLEADP